MQKKNIPIIFISSRINHIFLQSSLLFHFFYFKKTENFSFLIDFISPSQTHFFYLSDLQALRYLNQFFYYFIAFFVVSEEMNTK